MINDKPCPVFRSPLAENTNHVACSVISLLSDISCSYKNDGCLFEGSIDELKTHICGFKMVDCPVCYEESMTRSFHLHNMDCFMKDANNIFSFPTASRLYLIKNELTDKEILVDAWYCDEDEEDEVRIGFTIFDLRDSPDSQPDDLKIRILLTSPEKPGFSLEAIIVVSKGPYIWKEIEDRDLVLSVFKGKVFGVLKGKVFMNFKIIE